MTTAQIPDSAPGNRVDVAAVRGVAVDTDLDPTTSTYAGIFVSEDFRGLFAQGDSNEYAAWFAGDIYVTGNCNGCRMAMTARNIGQSIIEPGDFVTALGVDVDLDYEMPILLVRKAAAEDAILEVAENAMSQGEYHENGLAQLGYDKVTGVVETEGYVSIVTEGLIQAQAAHRI